MDKSIGNIGNWQPRKFNDFDRKITKSGILPELQKMLDNIMGHLKHQSQQIANLIQGDEVAETRAVALTRLLTAKGVLSDKEIDGEMRLVNIESFNEQTALMERQYNLSPVEEAKAGSLVYVSSTGVDTDGKNVVELDITRASLEAGKGRIPWDKDLIGIRDGDTKIITTDFRGKTVTLTVRCYGVREKLAETQAPSAEAPAETPVNPTGA